jgi:hypothetical protein
MVQQVIKGAYNQLIRCLELLSARVNASDCQNLVIPVKKGVAYRLRIWNFGWKWQKILARTWQSKRK